MKKKLWFEINWRKFSLKNIMKNVNFFYIFLLFFHFFLFSVINVFVQIVMAEEVDRIEIIDENIQDLSLYFLPYDAEFSSYLLEANNMLEKYQNWDNILSKEANNISDIMDFFANNPDFFNKLGFQEFEDFLDFFAKSNNYQEDIFSILGKDTTRKYIIALENTNEVRPNWGFFGSFILLEVDNWHFDYELIDSYEVEEALDWEWIQPPERRSEYVSRNQISFISSNVFWFTDKDGENIKKLYEMAFPDEEIDWVVFVEAEFLNKVLPYFYEKVREWQFVNAANNLIFDDDSTREKHIYFEQNREYIQENIDNLIQRFAKNFDLIINWSYVQLYLPFTSQEFRDFLVEHNLKTIFKENKWYFWDFNYSFNKIDWFIDKYIQVYNNGEIIKETTNEVIDFDKLPEWELRFVIIYSFTLPSMYIDYMNNLEEKYDIQLTEREEHILALDPVIQNMGQIYLPKDTEVLDVSWNLRSQEVFETWYSNNVIYILEWEGDNFYHRLELVLDN